MWHTMKLDKEAEGRCLFPWYFIRAALTVQYPASDDGSSISLRVSRTDELLA
jgi:hypothetical protein